MRATGEALRHWGRWGPEDQRGCANFITPAKIQAAGGLIRRGEIFSLALPLDVDGPQDPLKGRFNPIHKMTRYRGDNAQGQSQGQFCSSDDMAIIALQSSTQWDSLAHLWYEDRLYNGFPADTITAAGASRCAIGNWTRGIVSRGVLLDIARLKGQPRLDAGYPVTPEDLDAAEARQGVRVTSGDVVLIRTGVLGDWQATRGGLADQPGLELRCAAWLHAREAAAVCADNSAVEVIRQPRGLPLCAFHMVALRDMGLLLGELF
ncbi:MAG: cyclase family protein, partial [Dehalococcoidia bacterium]|nr:cyclase family protein [Dehalococcoidia bacterium]